MMFTRKYLKQMAVEDELIFITLAVISSLSRVKADLLVILLKGSKILPGFGELTLLHTFSNVPVDESLLAYMRSNLWSSLAQASAMAVVLESMHTALLILARSPPGTMVGGW